MSKSVKSSLFIVDLNGLGSDPARLVTGAGRQISAAALASLVRSERARVIAQLIRVGEAAQSRRDAAALKDISQRLLQLADNPEQYWAGSYYGAIALNRGGPAAYPMANSILEKVADLGSPIHRAKGYIALGINIRGTGDHKGARALYDDALRIVSSREGGSPLVEFLVGCQNAFIKYIEGDIAGAVKDFTAQMALAPQLGPEHAPFAHHYFNNLVAVLTDHGQVRDARRFSKILRVSPFADRYPEWATTCATVDLAVAQQHGSKSFAAISECVTEVSALSASEKSALDSSGDVQPNPELAQAEAASARQPSRAHARNRRRRVRRRGRASRNSY
jgi:hypothetical protein